MGADITFKQDGNDLEFNIIKGSHDAIMHKRSRKYKEGTGIAFNSPFVLWEPIGARSGNNKSHYHDNIDIPQYVVKKGVTYTVRYLDESLMFQASKLTGITIPGTVKEIPHCAFSNCFNLKKITFNEGTEFIGAMAFAGCHDLNEIQLPRSLTTLENNAFSCCSNLVYVNLSSGIKVVGEHCFSQSSSIRTVRCNTVIPPSVGKEPFDNEVIKNAVLMVPQGSLQNYLAHPGWNVFRHIEEMERSRPTSHSTTVSTTRPSTASGQGGTSSSGRGGTPSRPSSGYGVNPNSANLAKDGDNILVNGIRYWVKDAAKRVVYVTGHPNKYKGEIIIPATVQYNGVTCNVTKVGKYAFDRCQELTAVTLPSSIVDVKDKAFYGCTSLNRVTCYAATPPVVGTDAIPQALGNRATLVVPRVSTLYSTAAGWNVFKSISYAL